MTAYYTPNDCFTANDASFYKKKVDYLCYMLQCLQLIMYAKIKITKRYIHVLRYILLYDFATKQQEKKNIN